MSKDFLSQLEDYFISIDNIKLGTPLRYDKYRKYYIGSNGPGQWLFKFKNRYGASVIKHRGSYGFEEDKFELGVIYFYNPLEPNKYELSYNTPITNNVIGYLTNEEVLELLERIKKLDKEE